MRQAVLGLLASGFPKLAGWNALLCGVSLLFCQSAPVGRPVTPGSEASTYHPHLTFDVASIREYRSNGGMRYIDNMPHNSYYHAEGVAPWGLIAHAYDLHLLNQVENLPRWAHDTLYTIDAKSDPESDEALEKLSDSDAWAEKNHMLQVLLAERFHLQIHSETRMSDTYELITTSRTAKLMTPVHGDVGKTISTCSMHVTHKGGELDSKGCPFNIFFNELEQMLATDVLDRTGMTGMYAFHLMWWPDQLPEPDSSADEYPPLKAAVREQLGLELKPAKGPMTFWVVDHIELPTPN
jgi:uncharacterized protein (TIGR03435 family)